MPSYTWFVCPIHATKLINPWLASSTNTATSIMAKKRAPSEAPAPAPPPPAYECTPPNIVPALRGSEQQPGDAWEDVDGDEDELELELEPDAESVPAPKVARQAGKRERSARASIGVPRRRIGRRPKAKIVFPIAGPRRQMSKHPTPAASTPVKRVPTDELAAHACTGLCSILYYFVTVFGRAISLLKLPLFLLLGLFIFALLLDSAASILRRTSAYTCRLPFASSLALCAPPPPMRWADLVRMGVELYYRE
ncbi:hypothetical protein BD779DRAFT_1494235 [Infundibulicybe gibba]|nr:hypothetical protein BD779DRAFT_1494235 [Infundibulicybe gibba]